MLEDAYRAVTSKAARRTLVYGVILALASTLLYGVAVVGYIGFYRDYVPHRVRTAPLYLQYGKTSAFSALAHPHQPQHPFAIADLRGLSLKTDQEYDISVSLSLPRSPANMAAGNFMVELALVSGGGGGGSSAWSSSQSPADDIATAARLPPADPRDFLLSAGRSLVYAAARPALLAYADPLVATAARLVFLPYHLLAPAAAPEAARLVVPMAESLAFSSPDGLPAALYVEVRATAAGDTGHHQLQTYAVEVVFAARLRGLRWFMYRHSVASFFVLTGAFWLVEVLFMAGACAILGTFLSGGSGDGGGGGGGEVGGGGGGYDDYGDYGREGEGASNISSPVKKEKREEEEASGAGRSLLASIPAAPGGRDDGETSADDNADDEGAGSDREDGSSDQEAFLAEQTPTATATGSLAATESSLRQRQQPQPSSA